MSVVLLIGCGTGDPEFAGAPLGDAAGAAAFGDGASPYAPTGTVAVPSVATQAASGLPCEMRTLVNNVCGTCHRNPPAAGAPMSLATYDDWMRKNATGMTYADVSLARMQNPSAPMPPKPAAPATQAQIGAVRAFIASGYAKTGCGDGGAPTPAACTNCSDAAAALAVVCTSGKHWPSADTSQSGLMQPGRVCINCHQARLGEPKIDFGGTLYPTFHEPDLCYGANIMGSVIVTDANGTAFSAPINAHGNFLVQAGTGATPPFHAKIVSGGKEKAMMRTVDTGDCNSCHTESGANGAPGRITVP